MTDSIQIYTDGACRRNPGPGGWGAIIIDGSGQRTLSGAEPETTNNRMEMMAAIKALDSLERQCRIELFTDSKYLRNGIISWMATWKRNGWRTATGSPVKNIDLWQELDRLSVKHKIIWRWLKGHAGHEHNEAADQLATAAINRLGSV